VQEMDSTEETQVQKIDFLQTQRVPNILLNEKAVVITDNLNIRNAPSLNGTIIDKYHFGKIVIIYAIRDYKNTINGEYNCWYKLSNAEEVWANALFIKRFPFFINSVEKDYQDSSITIEINNIEQIGSKYYFSIYLLPDSENSIQIEINKTILVNDLHFNIIDNNYDNVYKLTYENMRKLKIELLPIIIQEKYLVEGTFGSSGSTYHMPGYKARYLVWDNGFISKLEISNKDEYFLSGLRIGEKSSYLEKILGFPAEIRYSESYNPIWIYLTSFNNNHVPQTISFEIENENIVNIKWEELL
jgi:hypothetical protein